MDNQTTDSLGTQLSSTAPVPDMSSQIPPPSIPSKKNKKNFLLIGGFLIFVSVIFSMTILLRRTTLTTKNEAATANSCTYNADIVLVLDRSSSMNSKETDGRTKLEWAKQSAKTLVDRIAQTPGVTSKVGVASFGSQGNDGTGARSSDYNSTLHIAPTSNYASVQTAIDGVHFINSGTCIECGLRIANQQLSSSKAKDRVVILLSDGKANHNWAGTSANGTGAITQANQGRSTGFEYYVLGYGTGSNIDETTLKAIAGPSANYKYKPNVQDWPSAFLEILDQICVTPTSTPTKPPHRNQPIRLRQLVPQRQNQPTLQFPQKLQHQP